MTSATETPIAHTDPINAQILAVSEDRIQGFVRDPFGDIAAQSGLDPELVMERVRAMLRGGTIRRVRQTLMATNLAEGALVAWQFPADKLDEAFDFMFREDPFSGHVVIRSTDAATPGSNYRLWTTVKVPQGYSIEEHCALLARLTSAEHFRVMPANRIFALGVGHVRRKGMEPGSKSDELAVVKDTAKVELSDLEWQVLTALKRELTPDEVSRDLWQRRADEAGVPLETFLDVAETLNRRGVIG
ncbi:MAG TPA: Lrp/AsnC family transcriptional regulator, partial [Thermoanaerobaculia bacterium]